MALLLRLKTTRPKSHSLTNSPYLHHLFSTTGGDGDGDGKSSLKRQPTTNSSQNASVSDMMSKIQSFRNRTDAPVSDDPSPAKQISFQEIYSKMQDRSGVKTASEGSKHGTITPSGGGTGGGKSFGFNAIRESLSKLQNTNQVPTPKWRPSSPVINGRPTPNFSKNFGYARLYMHEELGEKLKKLRPQVKGKDWFSIAELSERLKKVREMDEIEASSNTNDDSNQIFSHLYHHFSCG